MKKLLISSLCMVLYVFAYSDSGITELQNKLHSIAEDESQSVVFISTEKTVTRTQGAFDPFEFFFNTPRGNQDNGPKQKEFKQSALGSGVIYSKKGNDYYIITNNHVIEGADKVKITVDGRKQYDAEIVGSDTFVDVAVIKVNTKDNLRTAKIGDSTKLKRADFVVAIGNPFGLSHSVTFGIISALGRNDLDQSKPGFTNFIQTDTAINPGNSGGPLLNIEGEVIGINTMIYSQSGGSIGIGFAIPINIAKNIAGQLIDTGKTEHGWIGISFQELDKERLEKLGVTQTEFGMLVMQVVKDGPADKAGIKTGDVVTRIDTTDIVRSGDLTVIIGNTRPGTRLAVTFIRNKATLMKYITVGKREVEGAEQGVNNKQDSTGLADKFGLTMNEKRGGLEVVDVAIGSRAAQAGVRKGDIITKVNNVDIKTLNDFNRIASGDDTIYIFIERDGETVILMM